AASANASSRSKSTRAEIAASSRTLQEPDPPFLRCVRLRHQPRMDMMYSCTVPVRFDFKRQMGESNSPVHSLLRSNSNASAKFRLHIQIDADPRVHHPASQARSRLRSETG